METESLSKTLESTLRSALQGEVRFDRISRAIYSTDASIYQIMPRGVVVPRCVEDVIRTVRTCRRYGVPITARGGGPPRPARPSAAVSNWISPST